MPDWQAILSRDGPPAWRTAFRLLGNRADADDCFQEACLAALAVSRREAVQNWRGLLQRLAASRAVDRLRVRRRSRTRQSLADCAQLRDGCPSPDQGAVEAELADDLRVALGALPPSQAEVFCLHCIEDWSYEEISRNLGISTSFVGVQVHRARKRLRKLLAAFDRQDTIAPSPAPCSTPPKNRGR
ncbi:MAG: sigma-70 family RNA polymerase sigma factor [Isosphaeraceae bacterium]